MKTTILALALLAASPQAFATQWQPKAELGVVNTTGNSDTTSVNGRFALNGEDENLTQDYFLAGLRAESDDELSANRYELGGKLAHKFNERHYLGAVARYENDDFAAYDYQATLAMNYGFWAIKDEDRSLQIEGGPGLRRSQLSESGEAENDALLRGYLDYQHQFTPSARFYNTLLVEAARDNSFLQNDIGIAVSINRSLALKAGFQARHNTDVPDDRKRTDTLTSVNIVWSPKPASR